MSDNKGFGEILLIIGIALLLVGIGVGMYIAMFSRTIAYAYAGNYIPTWFAGLIAVTFIILGILLIVLGARELGFRYGKTFSHAYVTFFDFLAMFKILKSE